MKQTILTCFLLVAGCAASAQVAVSDLDRMSQEELDTCLVEAARELKFLSEFHIDPPPAPGPEDKRDETILRILTVEAEKWFFERYRARHLDPPREAPTYGVDPSTPLDVSKLTQKRDGDDLVVSVPVPRWSGTECRVLTDAASVGGLTILVVRLQYTGEPRGIRKEFPVLWRLVGQADKTHSFIVRRFPDTRTDEEASNKTPAPVPLKAAPSASSSVR